MTEKKRSTYKRGSKLDLPKDIDKSKYGYRWISAERLAAATDGYESRGWELHTTAEGKHVRRDDLILGRMPKDMHDDMAAQKDDDRKSQMALMFEKQAAEEEQLAHEFKKVGGKVKFKFEQN